MLKKNKGITLIALVVTIIVLLILAGISIATLTGQNGIITRTNDARDESVRARERDEIGLAFNAAKITNEENNKAFVDAEDLQIALRADEVQNANTSQEGESIKIIYTDSGNIYYINDKGEIIEGGKYTPGPREGLKVGDYINYTPDTTSAYASAKLADTISGSNKNTTDITQDTLHWQILRIYEDGKMDLIGSPTSQEIWMKDAIGYNNGVYVMHDICEGLYSKPSQGITARSVNYEDFEYWLTEEGKGIRDNYKTDNYTPIQYGQTNTYLMNNMYPNLYAHENGSGINTTTVRTDGIGVSDKSAPEFPVPTTQTFSRGDRTLGLTATQTFWETTMNAANFGAGNLSLHNANPYWVASRFVNCQQSSAILGLRYAGTELKGHSIFNSGDEIGIHYSSKLRPVVSLGSDIQVTKSEGTNSISNTHIINW